MAQPTAKLMPSQAPALVLPRMYQLGQAKSRIIASDNFDRVDAATLGWANTGHLWVALDGTWTVASGKAKQTATAADRFVVLNTGTGEVDLSAKIRNSAWGSGYAGLIVRCTDANNMLLFVISSANMRLYKRDGGTFTSLASVSYGSTFSAPANNTDYTLRVLAQGNTISTYRDGVLVHFYTLTGDEAVKFNNSKTLCGLHTSYQNTVLHDDFEVMAA